MANSNIHPQAYIEDGAQIGDNVTVEPFAVIKRGVTLKDGVTIKSHAYIEGNTTIGEGTVIYPSASIGTKTQDLKYDGEPTYVEIGRNCQIREFATINSSCGSNSTVKIGDNCLIMAYCHVAHNCTVGNNVVMTNNAILAGHVEVEDYVIIGGMTPIHQRVRIGRNAMVGGLSRVTHDVPPFTIGGGIPYKMGGLNLVGLKRRNFPFETRQLLTNCYRLVYRSGMHLDQALDQIEAEVEMVGEVQHFVDFCRRSSRGLIGLQGIACKADVGDLGVDMDTMLEEQLVGS